MRFFNLLGGDAKSMSLAEILKKKLSYEQFSKLLGESRLDKAVNVKKIDSQMNYKSGNNDDLKFDSKIKAVVTSKFNELVLIFKQTQNGEGEITSEEVMRVMVLYGISNNDAKKAVSKYSNWKTFMKKHDHFKRDIEDDKKDDKGTNNDTEKTENVNEKKTNNATEQDTNTNCKPLNTSTLDITNNLKAISGISLKRPASAASTIFSQRSLTLGKM